MQTDNQTIDPSAMALEEAAKAGQVKTDEQIEAEREAKIDRSSYTTLEELRRGLVLFVGIINDRKFLFVKTALTTKAAKKLNRERESLTRQDGVLRRSLQKLQLKDVETAADIDAAQTLVDQINTTNARMEESLGEKVAAKIPLWYPESGKAIDDMTPWLESDASVDKRVEFSKDLILEAFEDDWDKAHSLLDDCAKGVVPKLTISNSSK